MSCTHAHTGCFDCGADRLEVERNRNALLSGIRAGLEAAAQLADDREGAESLGDPIRSLDPAAIAAEMEKKG